MSAGQLTIAQGNEGQVEAWDGGEGELWARHAEFFDTSLRHHQARFMEAAEVAAGARVLDIGCGTGETTRAAARAAGSGVAVGIDLSSKMLQRARELAGQEGLTNTFFIQADAQVHRFEPPSFDVVLSRTGSMFFSDQVAAFTNIGRAMSRGGRLALLSWQGPDRNEWLSAFTEALTLGKGLAPPPPGAPSPFAHADPERATEILTKAGFEHVATEGLELPMYFGTGAEEGYAVLSEMLGWMTADLQAADRTRALENLRSTLVAHQTSDGVAYGSASWLITARRA
jgi:SAM-dependent methyltransferase